MQIAITASGDTLDDPIDVRFGRARCFLLVDSESGAVAAHDNLPNLNAAQGAGIQAAQAVANLGAEALLTGNVGPKAFRVLQAAGVRIFLTSDGTAADALRRFQADELQEVGSPTVEGHWQ